MLHIKSKMKALLVSLGAGLFLLGNSLSAEAGQVNPIYYDEETDTNYYEDDATTVVDISKDGDNSVCMYIYEDGMGLIHGVGVLQNFEVCYSGKSFYGYFVEIEPINELVKKVIVTENSDIIANEKMDAMFSCFWYLEEINLRNIDTSTVTSMGAMFSYCSKITSLDLSNFNTSNVTDMRHTFSNCKSLTSLDLSNFDTSSVTDMDWMFSGCSGLISLKAPKIVTSEIELPYQMYNEEGSLCDVIQIADRSITYTKEKVKEIISSILDTVEKECKVSTIVSSSFSVVIPLTISPVVEEDEEYGTIGYASYDISIKGDIGGNDELCVGPDETFVMRSVGKNDVIAYTNQDEYYFCWDDIQGEGCTVMGEIAIPGLTAGQWNGNFIYYVELYD